MARPPTPIEAFLAPLARLAARDPEIEGHVFWAVNGVWPDAPADTPTDTPAEALESEEIAFYAEGLLAEGFCLIWQVIGTPEDGPEVIVLYFWQGGAAAHPGPPPDFGPVLDTAEWIP